MREIKDYIEGKSGPPYMLAEGQLIERFGWTFDELDQQDSGRTFQTVAMMNLTALYKDVLSAVHRHTITSLTTAHWDAYKTIRKA